MPSYRNSAGDLPIMQGSPPSLIVPRAEWDRPPWNRWSFQHVREILPTAEVWRGTGPVRDIPRNERDLDGLPVRNVEGNEASLTEFLDETYTDGFIVLKAGEIAYERYFNSMTPRTLHLSQSVGKSIVGAVAGILAGRGDIAVDASVADYLPELSGTAWAGALIQHVLDMTSGVKFSEEYTDPYSDVGLIDVASGWKPPPPDADPSFRWPRHVWEVIAGRMESEQRHGESFHYRSIETDVLAFCLERVTGMRLPELVSTELWQKMGAEESACFTVDPAGYALGDGGFNATLRDYARFGQLYLEHGGGIVPADWIEATRNGNHGIFGEPYTQSLPRGAYRNQFWIEDPESRSIMARGVFGQLIYISWQHQLVAVKLSSWPDFLNPHFNVITQRAIHTIAGALA